MSDAVHVSIHGGGLGDCWASVNWCLSQEADVSLYTKTDRGDCRNELVTEILSLLDVDKGLTLVTDPGRKLTWQEVYRARYFPTKLKWAPEKSCIAYQFDGKNKRRITNCPTADVEMFHRRFVGARLFRLGRPKSLTESVIELMSCEYFVGVDSGFAHVSCSMGLPTFILRNRRTWENIHSETYPDKAVTSFSSMQEFLSWRDAQ